MKLCRICNQANGGVFPEGTCHICESKMPDIDEMANKAAELLENTDSTNFSISTAIPKDWMINEDDVWDILIGRSIKDFLNSYFSRHIEEAAGMEYVPDGDCRVIFDMRSGKISKKNNDLFIFGRYKKYKTGISQSRWTCRSCNGGGCAKCEGRGRRYISIEEIIGNVMKKHTKGGDFSMHASGREDVDAKNTAGRPFVMRIRNPDVRKIDLEEISSEINADGWVGVEDLSLAERKDVELVTESHFDKVYLVEVESDRELTKEDSGKIESLSGVILKQRTPKRVSHRRSDIIRNRRIMALDVLNIEGNKAMIKIKAEAGTYIKELISSDQGRTRPSIAEILGIGIRCTELTVSEIEDDYLKMLGF